MFSHINMDKGTPLISRELIFELICHTTTKTGLKILSELNTNTYKKCILVTKKFNELSIMPKSSTENGITRFLLL